MIDQDPRKGAFLVEHVVAVLLLFLLVSMAWALLARHREVGRRLSHRASGLEKLGRDYFPEAVQIVDFFHAMEHLQVLIELLIDKDHAKRIERRRNHWKKLLLADGLERIITRARKEALARGKVRDVEKALGYFLNNRERMRYGSFQAKGWFIGSGVIEAGCRSVIGQRCKQSGMFWSEPGARNILALRCIHASHSLGDFWKDHLDARAALNDPLALVA